MPTYVLVWLAALVNPIFLSFIICILHLFLKAHVCQLTSSCGWPLSSTQSFYLLFCILYLFFFIIRTWRRTCQPMCWCGLPLWSTQSSMSRATPPTGLSPGSWHNNDIHVLKISVNNHLFLQGKNDKSVVFGECDVNDSNTLVDCKIPNKSQIY